MERASPLAVGVPPIPAVRRRRPGSADPPAGFAYALWQDAFVKHFDLAAMLRYDVADASRLQWLEARYHFTRADLALQAQYNSGDATSNFGALFERRAWQVLLRYFL